MGNTEVKERDHLRKEGRVSVSDAAEGVGQVGQGKKTNEYVDKAIGLLALRKGALTICQALCLLYLPMYNIN